jgi:pilus assembly protein FimV
MVEEPVAAAAVEAAEPAEAAALDFDLDIGTTEASGSAATAAAPAAEAEVAALDFDLDLGAPETASAEAAKPAEAASEIAALDIDFDMPAKEAEPPALDFPISVEAPAAALETPAVAAPADSGSIDFEFDLGTPAAAPAEPAITLDLPTPEPVGLDLGSISLELDTPAAAVEAAAAPAAGDVADNPEVATKIELAMAYEEMGDRDGARELFQEALAEGSPAQQQVARAKLDSLG